MKFSDYRAMDATAMIKGIRDKEFTADELLDAARARLEQVNTRINAVILDLGAEAAEQIQEGLPTGPLSGVPFVVKDMDGTLGGQHS